MPDKAALLQAVLRQLREERLRLSQALQENTHAATDPDSKAENKYDTRSLEVSYLAAGQAKQLEDMQASLRLLDGLKLRDFAPHEKIEMGALVELEIEEAVWQSYFLLPAGGGLLIEHEAQTITTLSSESPLYQLLMARQLGEPLENGMAISAIS